MLLALDRLGSSELASIICLTVFPLLALGGHAAFLDRLEGETTALLACSKDSRFPLLFGFAGPAVLEEQYFAQPSPETGTRHGLLVGITGLFGVTLLGFPIAGGR